MKKDESLSKQELQEMYTKLREFTICRLKSDSEEQVKSVEESPYWDAFALTTDTGKQLYSCLTDKALLGILRLHAQITGRSPSQGEIFWVWRTYIKTRFRKWPYALEKAGLPKSAGKDGQTLKEKRLREERKRQLLEQVQQEAIRLGRMPHPKDMPEVCAELRSFMATWAQVLEEAKIAPKFLSEKAVHKIEDLEDEYVPLLNEVKKQACILNRSPLHWEVEPALKKTLIQRCGSWRNVLHQIDLEPVTRINPFSSSSLDRKKKSDMGHRHALHDCCYKVLRIDEQGEADLNWIRRLAEKLGRTPNKKDVPANIRKRLQKSFGSWTNALFQLDMADHVKQ